jgi:hypothetical protein
MSEVAPAARRRQGAYLFVRKGSRRVNLDEILPERPARPASVAERLTPRDGAGGLRYRRPALDPAALDPRLSFFVHPEAPVCDLYRTTAGSLVALPPDPAEPLEMHPTVFNETLYWVSVVALGVGAVYAWYSIATLLRWIP